VLDGLVRVTAPTLLVGGSADGTWKPSALAPNAAIEVVELPGLDHSLQAPGDPAASVQALEQSIAIMDRFVSAALRA
jgi:predicted dienelactone hydrolase